MLLRGSLRLQHAQRISIACASTSSVPAYLRIGSVRIKRREAANPDFVPSFYGFEKQPPNDLIPHLRWLAQKDLLKQDVFLLGVPGKIRLELVLRYLEATNREFEYLSITRDTTEADIKQRREIRDGTAYYTDLCAVRAALAGRVLVIDGVERAERNVLPILNNLLENREMQLDDGRFLMKHDKYDHLKEKYDEATLKKMGMERVSENFHVVAMGLPIPRFPGNSLDPPFRSRFQCRNIQELSYQTFLTQSKEIAPKVSESELNDLISMVYAYNSETSSSRPRIATSVVEQCLKIWNENPTYSASEIVNICYPAKEILADSEKDLIDQFKTKFELKNHEHPRHVVGKAEDGFVAIETNNRELEIEVPIAPQHSSVNSVWYATPNQESLLADLTIAFSKGDFVLIGPKGSGKSRILSELSRKLNFNYNTMVLHQDMNTRELIQRRHMKENGDTIWEDSILVKAARDGDVCVLDGVEMVHPSVLMSLSQLIFHRRLDLPNGDRLIGEKEFGNIMARDGVTEDELNQKGVFRIPNSFRVLLVGESQSKEHKWINENVLSILPVYNMPNLSVKEQLNIISQMCHDSNQDSIIQLASFVHKIKTSHDTGLRNASASLSLRRLIHIAKRDRLQPGHLRELVEKAALSKFLPALTKDTFEKELDEAEIFNDRKIRLKYEESYIDMIRAPTLRSEDEALIPNVLFHDNEQHLEILEDMARDMKLGSHLLLIGNQGVGKNKLTDRFLHLINRPRQYMQLHRDTTVQTLTMQTVVENGVIRHEDSALVKAARAGQILVVDEADKAPLHVVAILKSLLDTGNLVLGDGRMMRPENTLTAEELKNPRFVPIHKDFRIIMLANRPGFPFLGNNLFAVLGDLFAIHMIDHPSRESELEMIKKYGPNVEVKTLNTLLSIFNELREKTDQGLLQYPYSTRELVNIVRHCNEFPEDPLTEVCRNVFDFDTYSEETISTIEKVFQSHGIPLGIGQGGEKLSLVERMSLGEMRNVGQMSMSKFDFPKSYGFTGPRPAELMNPQNCDVVTQKMTKTGTRGTVFNEQVAHWKIPIQDQNIISDGIRIGDDLLTASVNPLRLYYMKNFMDTQKAKEVNISHLTPRPKSRWQPRIKMTHLGDNFVLLHEEDAHITYIINLNDMTGSVIEKSETISDQIGAIFATSKNSWKMSPPNGNLALLYECNASEMLIYSQDQGVINVQNGSVPFNIKRVFPSGPNQWVIVSDKNEHFVLRLENGEFVIDQIKHEVDMELDSIGARIQNDEMMLIAEPYHYLQNELKSDEKSPINGIVRKQVDDPVYRKSFVYSAERTATVDPSREVAFLGNTIIRSRPVWEVSKHFLNSNILPLKVGGFLEAIDTKAKNICYVPVMAPYQQNYNREWLASIEKTDFIMVPWSKDQLLTIDSEGEVRSFELTMSSIADSFQQWKRLTNGGEDGKMRMEFEKDEDKIDMTKLDEPKLGKVDPNNTPHHGGNQWMGGTGGYNTAGLGGVGGPFRMDAGHDVHQMPDFVKQQVPDHILKKARAIAKSEYAKKLREIHMSEHDASSYNGIWKNVERNSKKLAAVVETLEAKKKEREWSKHQTSGDLDDGKLIEGVTGEQNIYRKRMDKVPDPGAPQTKPKRLKLCFDVSGSMYRFNGYDNRLRRSLEAALMMMTALDGKTDKVQYDIVGHSGDHPNVVFVKNGEHPKNDKERYDTLKRMVAHTQYCVSGDNTVECLQYAIKELAKKDDYDETVVILVSDANLNRYGISPEHLKKQIIKEPTVNCFVIFIGSLGNEAVELQKMMPAGKAFVLQDTTELPKIMETIFASTIAQ